MLLALSGAASAYVGPGAGFGIVTSFLVFLNAIVVSLLSALIWPVTFLLRFLRRRRRQYSRKARRVVILGMDGLSPEIAVKMMDQGKLPNMAGLRDSGTFAKMRTTCPGISPVAWSSFQTGVNPGKHSIFDFLAPDRKRYLAKLSSVETGSSVSGAGFGPFRRSVRKPFIRLLRKSRPFWTYLKDYGIRSTVLRVPITYPPEPLDGHLLSGMCVPDLRGTQGSYTVFSLEEPGGGSTGGIWRKIEKRGNGSWQALMPGPIGENGESAEVLLELRIKGEKARLSWKKGSIELTDSTLSDWLHITFRSGGSSVKGIARFCLTSAGDGSPVLYSTALNVDPFSPSVPISHPVHYARYLAGLYGPFATLGLAEETWALSNGAVTEGIFLDQVWSIFDERKRMFFDALDRTRDGLVVCVFDTSDRIQHMFWGAGTGTGTPVFDMYERMDLLLGETLKKLRKGDMLILMSDHGFTSFHTCIDFNRWLVENNYMVLCEGVETVDTSFKGVDWSRTRAWSMGLAGIMINMKGREALGIVEPGEHADRLMDEMSERLLQLEDGEGNRMINSVYRADHVYTGPYSGDGPDLIVGTKKGYRAGWGCVTGGVGDSVVYPNMKHWNGDHCHDRELVPATLASNLKLDTSGPEIIDIAPTVLRALGVKAPSHMEGVSLFVGDGEK